MPQEKVFINNDDKAMFVCPSCGKEKILDVSRYKDVGKTVRLKRICSCGYSHIVLLERRKFYRKSVAIPGIFMKENERETRKMLVIDLSRSGVKIETEEGVTLKLGERLFVEFRLDNRQKTLIRKEVFVRSVFGRQAGTEFCSRNHDNPIDKAYDMAIGFFTFPK
ncbi:PilZ domain-containing protein [Desulfobacterales bacterium HSG16]|nr:PilZ domain-containing protein [Desulfobacterales bacterium HSG16]